MYKRVLLKLSGEALSSESSTFDSEYLTNLALQLRKVQQLNVQIAIVVGGGNIMRGKFASQMGLSRVEADKMGMLGTVINALAVKAACQSNGIKAYVQSAVEMDRVCDLVDYQKAIDHLNAGYIVIYGGGTGNPYFSTDSCAALRACEINCEAILMAKNGVDGVYSADPKKDPQAIKYQQLSYMEMIEKQLQVMDLTAVSMCKENNIQTVVFNGNELENISKVLTDEKIGTVIK
ncbi:MAG: UMP kinase [Erysipelotrichia bacterium]|nr:UMP kinase [Erysipelotrichia bacterium]